MAEQGTTNRAGSAGLNRLLTPDNCTLVLIDHQPQMFFGVQSIDRQMLVNNVVGLAKAAKVFNIPTILTTIGAEGFSGLLIPELQSLFPNEQPIDRTTMNAWEDPQVIAAIQKAGRKKLVMAALWTEVCLAYPVICALADGYEVYAVADASGGVSAAAHDMAMQRMVQAGAVPATWMQVMFEMQRDWARQATAGAVMEVSKEHGGAYGIGLRYYSDLQGQRGRKAA